MRQRWISHTIWRENLQLQWRILETLSMQAAVDTHKDIDQTDNKVRTHFIEIGSVNQKYSLIQDFKNHRKTPRLFD